MAVLAPMPSADASVTMDPTRATAVRLGIYFAPVLMLAINWNGAFPLDDAYITMHNARSLLHGWDTTYGVSPLIGATSLVHLALLALLGVAMPLPYASLVICLLSAGIYAVGLDVLVRRAGARDCMALVLTLIGLLAGSMPTLLANGLETGLACAAVVWLLVLDRRLPLLAGIAPFVRPELAILASFALFKKLRKASNRDRLIAIGVALAVAIPLVAWSYLETGRLWPSTMAAKIEFFRELHWPLGQRARALADGLAFSGFIVLVPGLVGLRDLRAWGFLVAVLGTLMLTLPGSVEWNSGRYLGPLVPIAILGWAQAGTERVARILIVALAFYVASQVPQSLASLKEDRRWNRAQADALRASLNHIPSGSRILVHDAGMPAWVAPEMHLIDVVGLKTPSSMASHKASTREICHWGRALDQIARSQNAQYALVLQKPFWNCVGTNLADLGWKLSLLPSHDGEYSLYAVTKPSFTSARATAGASRPR